MRRSDILVSIAAVLLSAVAAAEPIAYPAKGQSAKQQDRDESECHGWAKKETGVDPVAVAEQSTASSGSPKNSGMGSGARGAGIGAMRGAADGNAAAGAAQGARRGRLMAAIRSRRQEKQQDAASAPDADVRAQLDKYDRAYGACLTGRGYSVK